MIALHIETQVNELVNWGFASALSVVLLGLVMTLVFLFLRGLGDAGAIGSTRRSRTSAVDDAQVQGPHPACGGVTEAPPTEVGAWLRSGNLTHRQGPISARRFDRPQRAWGWRSLQAFSLAILLFLALPVLLIVPMSFSLTSYLVFPPQGFTLRWYGEYLTDAQWMTSTALSLEVAGLTTIGAVVLGTLGALALGRGSFTLKTPAAAALLAPLIVPVIISAVAIYFLLARLGLVGTRWAFSLGHMVLAIPVVVLVVSAAVRRVDESLERAAMILGASGVRAFFRITLPLLRPSVIAGALFAFITSFDETVMALFLAGTTTTTLPKKMWEDLQFQIHPTIAAISTLLVALSVIVLVGALALEGRNRRESSWG